MSKLDLLKYGEYLDKIAFYVEPREEYRPRKKDLPRKVLEIVGVVEEIEKVVIPPEERREKREKDLPRKVLEIVEAIEEIEKVVIPPDETWERKELPNKIQGFMTNRRTLRTLTSDIERELSRAMGRPAKERLRLEEILPEMKDIISSLESIQHRFPSEDEERIPFDKLEKHIRQTLEDCENEAKWSRGILKRISTKIDPTKSEQIEFEDLPSRVASLVKSQASNLDVTRKETALNSEQISSRDGGVTDEGLKWYKDRISELERSIEDYQRREEESKILAGEKSEMLAKSYEEADDLRTSLNTKESEIEGLKVTESDLRESHASVKSALDKANIAKQQLRTTLEAAQGEIQDLKDSNVIAMKRAEKDKHTAIAEVEKKHGQHIEKLATKHSGEVAEQLGIAERQRKADLATQKKKYDVEKQGLQTLHVGEVEALQKLHSDEMKKQRGHARTLRTSLDEETQQHGQTRAEAQRQAKLHETQRLALEKQHSQAVTEQEKLHSAALKKAEADKAEAIEKLRKEHSRQAAESEKVWSFKLEKTIRDHEAEEAEWEEAVEKEKARSIQKIEEVMEKYKVVVEALETDLRVEKAGTAKKVQEAVQKHKDTIEKVEKQYREIHSKLLEQKEYPGLRDQEIVRGVSSKTGKVSIIGFANMVSKVTTFSEWEWREDREVWPKNTLTALVGTKQRRLKKLILGDAIWTTLFRLIFCSPFRILGKEGENLEADWNESFPSDDDETSNGYRWPIPTALSENYRWETCEAALNTLTTKSSPYAVLRSSFVEHQTQFQDRFFETVEAYVDINEKRERDLVEFLTETVRMWIVFCTQRYRLRIILPGSNESDPEKKSMMAQEQNDLEFTVAPKLQRHGNAKGEKLEEVSVISGCEGKVGAIHES